MEQMKRLESMLLNFIERSIKNREMMELVPSLTCELIEVWKLMYNERRQWDIPHHPSLPFSFYPKSCHREGDQ